MPLMHENHLVQGDQDQQLFTQLYHYLEALYCNTSLVMNKLESGSNESNLSISGHSRMDPALGLTLEFSASTPVMCEFSTFEKLLWGRMLSSSITHECQHFEDKTKVSLMLLRVLLYGRLTKLNLHGYARSHTHRAEDNHQVTVWRSTCSSNSTPHSDR